MIFNSLELKELIISTVKTITENENNRFIIQSPIKFDITMTVEKEKGGKYSFKLIESGARTNAVLIHRIQFQYDSIKLKLRPMAGVI